MSTFHAYVDAAHFHEALGKLRMNRVSITLYDVVKSTGEVKDVFRFTYEGRDYICLSHSERIRAGLEVAELIKRLLGVEYPTFIDDVESVPVIDNVRPTGQVFMPAYLLFRIPSGKLTASLRKLPIPAKAMLVLVVMLRFAPTIILEFGEVREAMKIRGFLRSVPTVLRHPLNTLEYAIVPMVFRSLKIADELSASAIVRGIESPYKKQSYYVSRISPLDAFLMLVSTAAGIVCCVLL